MIAAIAASRLCRSSDGLGWTSAHLSHQYEMPFHGQLAPRGMHLLVFHRSGSARVDTLVNGQALSATVEPDSVSILPARSPIELILHAPLETVHLHIASDMSLSSGPATHPCDGPVAPRAMLGIKDVDLAALVTLGLGMLHRFQGDTIAASIGRLASNHLQRLSRARASIRETGLSIAGFCAAIGFMDQHLEDPITVEDIARSQDMSAVHFTRLFRHGTGWPPHQFLINLRIGVARRLLSVESMPLAEIALACGFANQEHLTRLFKRHIGCPPGHYRRLWYNAGG